MMHTDSERSATTQPATPQLPTPMPRQDRVAYAVPTQVFGPDGAGRDGVSMNLSEGGLFIATGRVRRPLGRSRTAGRPGRPGGGHLGAPPRRRPR